MSNEAYKMISFIIKELSGMPHAHRSVIDGCYEAAIFNYHLKKPEESKDFIIEKVLMVLNTMR